MQAPQIRSGLVLVTIAASLIFAVNTPADRGASNSARAAAPQQDQQQLPESQKPLKVQTELVNLFATVRDKDHAILTNLKQEDFKDIRGWRGAESCFFLERSESADYAGDSCGYERQPAAPDSGRAGHGFEIRASGAA